MGYEESKVPKRQNDRYLKDIFEQNFADFLRFVFPNADVRFDLSKEIVFLDKEFPPPDSERGDGSVNRVADLLAEVQTPDKGEQWILIHTEIEGGHSADLPERVFDYWYRIRQKHKKTVETIVFFTGGGSQPKPSAFTDGTERTHVCFRYIACDIFALSEEKLMEMENPFSIVVLACRASLLEGKIPDMELNDIRLNIARKMIRQGFGRERTERFLYFLRNLVHTSDPKADKKYKEEVGILTKGTIDMNTLELARKHGWKTALNWELQKESNRGSNRGSNGELNGDSQKPKKRRRRKSFRWR